MVKNLPVNVGGAGGVNLVPGLGRCPGGGHGSPLQYSCMENPMDRGPWWITVYRVSESWTWLKWSDLVVMHAKAPTHTESCLTIYLGIMTQPSWRIEFTITSNSCELVPELLGGPLLHISSAFSVLTFITCMNNDHNHNGGGGGLVTELCPTLATPWSVACQTPLSMGFSIQEYWSGLPFPSPIITIIINNLVSAYHITLKITHQDRYTLTPILQVRKLRAPLTYMFHLSVFAEGLCLLLATHFFPPPPTLPSSWSQTLLIEKQGMFKCSLFQNAFS